MGNVIKAAKKAGIITLKPSAIAKTKQLLIVNIM